jgi:murein DD-endopeptidase MepM/ murein hydrolase activator NlpD
MSILSRDPIPTLVRARRRAVGGGTRRLIRVLAAAAVTGAWLWPVAAPHPVVEPFRAPPTPYSAGHRGVDIGAPAGSPVLAPADGVVHFAGVVVDRPLVSIDHGGGVLSSLEPVEPAVAAGDRVVRGQVIGTLQPGHCSPGACVHLGVRVDGEYVSPLLWLGGIPRAVLLPMDGG